MDYKIGDKVVCTDVNYLRGMRGSHMLQEGEEYEVEGVFPPDNLYDGPCLQLKGITDFGRACAFSAKRFNKAPATRTRYQHLALAADYTSPDDSFSVIQPTHGSKAHEKLKEMWDPYTQDWMHVGVDLGTPVEQSPDDSFSILSTDGPITLNGSDGEAFEILSGVSSNVRGPIPGSLQYTKQYGKITDGDGPCPHQWKEYVGFTDRFDYCTKCNAKKSQTPS